MKRSSFGPTILSPPLEIRLIARIHYDEFTKYLTYPGTEIADSHSRTRQKVELTRLTNQQLQELSTDVYDELIRLQSNSDIDQVHFLPARDKFHPKRNEARQKLAALPSSRFTDLISDIHYELVRRYPEFKGEASFSRPVSYCDPYASAMCKLSHDTIPSIRSQPQDLGRRPNAAGGGNSTSTSNSQSVTANNGVIIIGWITKAEEDIEASSGRNDDKHNNRLSRRASVWRHSARRVGSRVSVLFGEKRSAHDRMNKSRISTTNVANDSKRNAPRRPMSKSFNNPGSSCSIQ